MSSSNQHITLTALQGSIKQSLNERFALPLWVSAEISELKVNYSGHCYLELIDKDEKAGTTKAQVRAVIWRNNYAMLSSYFEAETGSRMEAGMKVLFKVLVSYHELYGLSLQIVDIDPSFTLGEAERARQMCIAQLQKDGVWEMNKQTPMPMLVQRIAVISSANAAGYQDFCNEISKSRYATSLTLFDAFMQGDAAESSIIAAFDEIAQRMDDFDAVVMIRGGGSVSDLSCFNSYRICSYVAQFPLPVITGIGHDKDVSVADMVAHLSLKTPTAVAGWIVQRLEQIDGWLEQAALQINDMAIAKIAAEKLSLEKMSSSIAVMSVQHLEREKMLIEQRNKSITDSSKSLIQTQMQRLRSMEEIAQAHSPARLLELGFAVARLQNSAIHSVGDVKSGDRVTIELADGEIIGVVE